MLKNRWYSIDIKLDEREENKIKGKNNGLPRLEVGTGIRLPPAFCRRNGLR